MVDVQMLGKGILRLLVVLSVAWVSTADAFSSAQPQSVHVAAYEFPPYYSAHLEQHVLGNLIAAINARQSDYQLHIVEVSPTQRHTQLSDNGCCELMLFQSPDWGWQERDGIVVGPALTRGADLVVARDDPYQALQQDAVVGGVRGYHYARTNYQHDLDLLEYEHRMYLSDSQLTLLNMLARERLEAVIVAQEFLDMMQRTQPELVARLHSNTIVDQTYQTHIIGLQDRAQVLDWLIEQLTAMADNGQLQALFDELGLAPHLVFTPEG